VVAVDVVGGDAHALGAAALQFGVDGHVSDRPPRSRRRAPGRGRLQGDSLLCGHGPDDGDSAPPRRVRRRRGTPLVCGAASSARQCWAVSSHRQRAARGGVRRRQRVAPVDCHTEDRPAAGVSHLTGDCMLAHTPHDDRVGPHAERDCLRSRRPGAHAARCVPVRARWGRARTGDRRSVRAGDRTADEHILEPGLTANRWLAVTRGSCSPDSTQPPSSDAYAAMTASPAIRPPAPAAVMTARL
jgi:hypothetical protein